MSWVASGNQRRRELFSVAISLLFLVAGILAVWFVQSVLEVEGDAILVAILVVPLLLYLMISGRVREFAAGSLSVTLNEVSREPVRQGSAQYVTVDAGARSDPKRPIMKTDPNRPEVVTLTLGESYRRDDVLGRLRTLAAMKPVPLLIIIDDRERVLAYMTYRSALDLLEREERGDAFVQLVSEGAPDAFDHGGGFSAVKTETLPDTATNADALRAMEETGLDALVVVDRRGRFEGLVERDRLLSRMFLALVTTPAAS